ncbi:MAG: 3-keto-5-aminohexanoate cleavage protein [Alphaproteobacteria bacterium]
MSDPRSALIVTVAPNGARRTKADHPALPITPDEIASCAAACRDAGAAMIHLHVRDREGRHLLAADAYRTATVAIRREAGEEIIVQVTSEAAGRYGVDQQMAVVRELRPEAVSLALREIVPDEAGEPKAAGFLDWLAVERILPQFIVYSPDEIDRYRALRGRGVIPGDRHFLLFVLGHYSTQRTSAPRDLLPFLAVHGEDPSPWAVCAFGAQESACALTAAGLGGHVRVGFENNLALSDGSRAPDNAALVVQVQTGAALLGRSLADGAEARDMLWGLMN